MAHKAEPLFINIKYKGYTEDAMPAQGSVVSSSLIICSCPSANAFLRNSVGFLRVLG